MAMLQGARGSCLLLLTLGLLASLSLMVEGNKLKPNIIYLLVDDLGWGDLQSHDPLMVTPNTERLREEGVFLNQSYVLPMCGPTRAALLTGRYPHTFGMQDNTVSDGNKLTWLNENFTLLPQEMQNLGYKTHMLGKWHLGFCHAGLLPRGRGFDTFYGFWLGAHHSHYNHTKGTDYAYDWWDGDHVDWSAKGHYQTDLLTNRALRIVEQSSKAQPFFMYLAYGAVHGPFEVPQHYIDTYCPHVTNTSRQIHCAMMAAVDEGLGKIVQALKDKGIYDDTAILFMSDNGGPVKDGSVNWPLRSGKKSLYEGGTRSYTILKAPGLKETNITWPGMAHAIDWFPTLVTMAGGRRPSYTHGKNLWWNMMLNKPSPRTSFIYNVDDHPDFNHIGFRHKQWKLLGSGQGQEVDPWVPDRLVPPYQLLEAGTPWEEDKTKYNSYQYLLYNIDEDPTERNNLAKDPDHASIVRMMKNKIMYYVGKPGVKDGVFPLQPIDLKPPKGRNYKANGHYATCWCQPAGLANSKLCPLGKRHDCPVLRKPT